MPYLTRTWQAPGGWKGEGWPRDKVTAFERLMRAASVKRKGEPRLVDAWDDGRSVMCWYAARVCPEETVLRDKVREVFGAHERAGDTSAPRGT
jgi:hypothetical protein